MLKPLRFVYRILTLFPLVSTVVSASAQNLIPNPSFEFFRKCPKALGEIGKVDAWHSPNTGTPDYFNSCNQKAEQGVGVPNNYFATQAAFEGKGYAGIYRGNEECEYLQVALVETLEAGKRYCLRFQASPEK